MKPFARNLKIAAGLSVLLLIATAPASAQTRPAPLNSLERNFEDPPQAAKLRCYWWWLNGYTTADTITRDLTQMKARGYAGVILVDAYSKEGTGNPTGAPYGGPAWMKLYLHALQLAQHLGMEISLTVTNGGNVGILGGSGVTPQDALKTLTSTRTQITGGRDTTIKLPAPATTNDYYQPIAVLAYPLRHGDPLPGAVDSARPAISSLIYKAAIHEGNFSMPRPESTIRNIASTPGEQDAMVHDVIDVSTHMAPDGTLHWNAPAGEWEILRIGYTDSTVVSLLPSGNSLGADMMNTQAFDHYWDSVVVPILAASKPYIGTSLRYLVTDSWESDAINWTGDFRQQFLRLRGYDPLPYLPIIDGRILDSRDTSDHFLADLRRTVADLIATRYYDHFSERAAAYGLGTHPEAGGPHSGPLDALRNFKGSAFPQTEFWAWSPEHRTTDEDRFFVKEAASAAHIYGKTFVAAEGFSCMGPEWAESPSQNLKPTFDRALTEGLNHLFWHESTSVPASEGLPGNEYFAGTHLNANATWWNQAEPVLRGLNRAQFLMQQGEPVGDLLYYYGEQVPQFARLKEDDPAHVLPGYDYDVTDEDALEHRMLTTSGKLSTPEGIHYRALALPYSRALSLAALTWLEKYVRVGGMAIGLEPQGPLGIIPASQLSQYKHLVTSMWQQCASDRGINSVHYGQGRIYCTQDAHAVFEAMHLSPDFTYTASDSTVSLDYIHRRTSTAEIYFVRNANDSPAQATLTFRVHGRTPEFWNMDSGERTPALVYSESGDQTSIPVSMPAHGSIFVVFQQPSTIHAVEATHDGQPLFPSVESGAFTYASLNNTHTLNLFAAEPGDYQLKLSNGKQQTLYIASTSARPALTGPWTLSFPPNWGAPASITMDHLQSWTESSIPGVRYFSGTATYTNSIDVPADLLSSHSAIWLNLGEAREIVTIAVNGKDLRTLWHGPYKVRIDAALHAGANRLSIRVTNLWPNRIIGDKQPSETVHYTHTNAEHYTKDSPLLPSGLLTPVTFDVFADQPVQ